MDTLSPWDAVPGFIRIVKMKSIPPKYSMTDLKDAHNPIEPELLVATFSPKGAILFRNDAWIRTFGDDEAPWCRLLVEDQTQAQQLVLDSVAGSLVTNQLFLSHVPGRDEPVPVLLNFLPVHERDENGDLNVLAVTITAETLAEPSTWTENQTQRHRMETLGRMTMGIAHDFNNLLSSVLGHIELLKCEPNNTFPPAFFEEHLYPIEQAALDGAALVNKIQQYIRQEKQTSFEPVDVPTLIRDVVVLTRPYWYNEPRRQGIAIDMITELEAVPPIMGAPSELRDVFVNLILNAVQALPRGGTITMSTEQVPEKGVVVHVSDTGTGMTDRVRSRIFEPLFTTKGNRGTGMGLAVCYGIVQEHEGTIEARSKLAMGTTFTLSFPPADSEIIIEETVQQKIPDEAKRILVVDDERGVRHVLIRLLALKGHKVDGAASGAEALALTETKPFDLVFTDHGMPGMNGRQLAGALRQRFPDLPIILLTGDTEAGIADSSVDLVLSKPFNLEKLTGAIHELLP